MDPHPSGCLCPSRDRKAAGCSEGSVPRFTDWYLFLCCYGRLNNGGLWVPRIQSRSPVAGLSRGNKSPPSAGGKTAGIHLGWVGWLRKVGGEQPGPAGRAAAGSCEYQGGERRWPWLSQATCCPWRACFLDSVVSRKISGGTLVGWQAGWGTHHWETHGVCVSQGFPGQLCLVCASASVQSWILWEASLGQITVQSCRSGQRMNAETL